ncbi:MAG: hypothetical protein QW112_03870, partial [Candidatus Micrarchaeia archaeon]
AGLGRIVAEEMERIAEMQKQSATDRRKVATKIRKVLDERKGYEDAMKDLLGLVDKARSMGEKLGKEDILKELVRIAGRGKTGIGRDLQDIITEARKEERRKEDILSDIREAAGSFVRKLAVIEAVQKLLPRAAELERQDLIDKMQRIVSQWRKEEQSLGAVEREMLKMIEKGIGDEEFKKKAKELLKGKPDIEREVLKLKPDAAVAYVRGIVRELQSNEHIQELKDMISSPLSRDELITEINSIVKGESEAVALSRRITSILRKADDPRVGTQDLIKQLKEASRLAEESELNIKLREILAKTERMGMSKEFLVSRLREISSLHERQLEVATEISAIVVASERMTKKELIENLKRITSACRREADFFETAFKNLKKLLFKRPSSEEFFSRMDDELRGREWAVRDVKRRKLTPGQAIEMFREIAEGLKSNPYVRRLDSIIDREKALQKTEIINALKELDKEIQQTKRIITELSNLVGAHDREVEEVEKEARAGKVVGVSSLSREDILLAVESLARSTSSDRLGRKLQRITDRARKEGMSRDDIIHEIIRMLPTENNFLTIFSRLRWALENDDIKELNRLMGMLYRVNFEILSIDITVKKYMAQDGKGAAQEQASKAAIADTARKVLHKISILSHKEEEREAGIFVDGILRRLVDEPDAVERGRLINLLIDTCASSRPSIRRIMAVKLERFLRGPYSSVSSILSSIPNSCVPRVARLCLNDKDLSAKAASTKLLSRYFDMLSEHAWILNPDIISRHIDESVNAIVIGGVAGPESLKMSALNALKKVAVRNKNAALAIKILAKDRSENVSSAAKEIIKDLML